MVEPTPEECSGGGRCIRNKKKKKNMVFSFHFLF